LNEELKRKLRRYVDEKGKEIIKLCSDLVRIPSENPPCNMTEISSFIRGWLEDRGFTVEAYEPEKGMISLVTKIGEAERPALILNGHMDVVPAGDPKRWEFPPYCGEVRGGKILGRGATDMKGGLTSFIAAFTVVSELAEGLPGRLILNAVPDEETGGQYGSKWLVDTGRVYGDACLIGEPSGIISSFVGEKGLCWLRLKSKGLPGHGSLPMLGENAIEKLAKAFPIIKRIEGEKIEIPSETSGTIKSSKNFYEEMMRKRGITEEAKLESIANAVDHNTVNIGVIQGGIKTNMVPESCTVDVDLRVPAGGKPEDAKRRVEDLLREAGFTAIDCELTLRSDPSYTSPTERIYTVLSQNVEEVLGVELKPLLITGATDGRHFRLKGIPAINYGPGQLAIAHAYNECLSVDDLIKAVKVVGGTILDFIYS
jgi:succinyl-diaminopimelate desuccinylase